MTEEIIQQAQEMIEMEHPFNSPLRHMRLSFDYYIVNSISVEFLFMYL